jgi:hypothetical protein
MSTALKEAARYQDLEVVSKHVIDEFNNGETGATSQTPISGLFVNPSVVAGRPDDISGYVYTATENGKAQITDPVDLAADMSLGDLNGVEITSPAAGQYLQFDGADWINQSVNLDDLGDVTITAPAANNIISFDGADWVNGNTVTLATVTTTNMGTGAAATDLVGFYGEAAIARPAVDGTTVTGFAANSSTIASGDATYGGYTVGGLVEVLRTIGLIT